MSNPLIQSFLAVNKGGNLTNYFRDWLRKLRTDVDTLQANAIADGTTDGSVLGWDDTGSAWTENTDVIIDGVNAQLEVTPTGYGDFGRALLINADTNWARVDLRGSGVASGSEATLYQTSGGVAVVRNLSDGSYLLIRQDGSGSIRFDIDGTELFRIDNDSRLKATSGAFQENGYTIPDSATPPIDPANGQMQIWNMAQSATPTFTNFANGDSVTLHVDDGTGYTITWPATIRWVGGSEPTLDTAARNIIVLWQVSGTIYGSFAGAASTA